MLIALYFVSVFIAFLYIFIITHILTSWNEINEWETTESFTPDVKISVVIPYRNEASTIRHCIDSVLKNHYPKSLLEIICVDDHSEDGSSMVIDQIQNKQVVNLSLDESLGKKAAIAEGVRHATGRLVVTMDADCIAPKKWLYQIASYYSYTKKRMMVGMIELEGRKNTLEYFQIMDTCGVMGLHAAGIHNKTHFLANGANLIFEKSLFEEIRPFEGNKYASGDDIFFVNKVASKQPDSIGFLKCKEAVVTGNAEVLWKDLWQQRKRWATKNNAYSSGIYKWMTATIWLLSLSIVANLILIPFTQGLSLFVALTQLLIKGIMDFLYLQNMCTYFNKSKVLGYFIPAFLVQTFYIMIAGFFALKGGKYEWKKRTVT
jgi:cellulose synthase/poly-beta-1,6-N-acetylglucosamine synthase-like glycosyltransferase